MTFGMRAGTLLKRVDCRADETLLLQGGAGGSYLGGVAYIERGEEWPACVHGVPMQLELQVDGRDALHSPGIDGLFVVFSCRAPIKAQIAFLVEGRDCGPVVRHYARPRADRRIAYPFEPTAWASQLVPTTVAEFTPDCALRWGDHLGGWGAPVVDRNALPRDCPSCGEIPALVAQLEWGDGNRSLWACPRHPEHAHFAFHK